MFDGESRPLEALLKMLERDRFAAPVAAAGKAGDGDETPEVLRLKENGLAGLLSCSSSSPLLCEYAACLAAGLTVSGSAGGESCLVGVPGALIVGA